MSDDLMDDDEREAERKFLRPINPDPLTTHTKEPVSTIECPVCKMRYKVGQYDQHAAKPAHRSREGKQ